MANPNPIYVVTFDGQDLPGYLVNEDVPVGMSFSSVKVMNRDGGFFDGHGADFKEINLTFRVLSRLDNNATGLAHLEDCKNQWREALAIVARADGKAPLLIGETDRYVNALFVESSAPLEAPVTSRITYTLRFIGEPWFNGATSSTEQIITGDDTIAFDPGESRRTYPIFTITSGLSSITITDQNWDQKFFSIDGVRTDDIIVDCGKLTITHGGDNGIQFLDSGPDFGMFFQGDDISTFGVDVSGVVGSGNVMIDIQLRYER